MSASRYQIGFLAVVALVALRVGVGWHFYTQGRNKLEPGFSSEPFLRQAKGPFASYYRSMLPDNHGFDDAMQELLADDQPTPKDIRQVLADKENPLNRWADRVKQAWGRYAAQAEAHYGYTKRPEKRPKTQINKDGKEVAVIEKDKDGNEKAVYEDATVDESDVAKTRLDVKLKELDAAVGEFRDWLSDNPHDLVHQYRLARSDTLGKVPYERPRLATQATEVEGPKNALLADVKRLEKELEADLWNVLSAERKAETSLLEQPASSLDRFDKFLTYSLLAIGVCLMIGLLTPLAAAGGALFLLTVIGTNPPWVMDAIPVHEQVIECLALLVLATTCAGRWAGLDFFLGRLCGCCCRGKKDPTV